MSSDHSDYEGDQAHQPAPQRSRHMSPLMMVAGTLAIIAPIAGQLYEIDMERRDKEAERQEQLARQLEEAMKDPKAGPAFRKLMGQSLPDDPDVVIEPAFAPRTPQP